MASGCLRIRGLPALCGAPRSLPCCSSSDCRTCILCIRERTVSAAGVENGQDATAETSTRREPLKEGEPSWRPPRPPPTARPEIKLSALD